MPHTNVSITLGATAEDILAADPTRQALMIVATTEAGWLKFGGTAAADDGIPIAQDAAYIFNAADFPDIKKAVNYLSATTGAKIALLTSQGA